MELHQSSLRDLGETTLSKKVLSCVCVDDVSARQLRPSARSRTIAVSNISGRMYLHSMLSANTGDCLHPQTLSLLFPIAPAFRSLRKRGPSGQSITH